MTIREALKTYPTIEADLLLAHVLKKPKEFLFLNPHKVLTKIQEATFIKLAKRRLKKEPIAYLVGYKYFYGLKFIVTKDTLIPRPETELLVDAALHQIRMSGSEIKNVLEVGTGSGCVAIAIAKNAPKVSITATDISLKALQVARQNARNNKTKTTFLKSDLLSNTKRDFDIIVANLPYGWKRSNYFSNWTNDDLSYEPSLALYAKNDGLALIEKLLNQISSLHHKPKVVLLEFDPRQKSALDILIKKYLPTSKTSFSKDLQKHWRVATIVL